VNLQCGLTTPTLIRCSSIASAEASGKTPRWMVSGWCWIDVLGNPLYAPICVEVDSMEEEGGSWRRAIVAALTGFFVMGSQRWVGRTE